MKFSLRLLAFFGLMSCVGVGWAFERGETNSSSSKKTPEIDHIPITSAEQGRALRIDAQINAPGRSLIYVRVYFRRMGESNFRFVDMRPGVSGYLGEIPGRIVQPPGLQYFLLALLSDQSVMSYPARNPYGQPFDIIVDEPNGQRGSGDPFKPESIPPRRDEPLGRRSTKTDSLTKPERISPQMQEKLRQMEAPKAGDFENTRTGAAFAVMSLANPILPLSPEPLSELPADEGALILASFAPEANIDSTSVRVMLDGKDVTARAQISSLLATVTVSQLKAGKHQVTVAANDRTGKRLNPKSWQFQVARKAEAVEFNAEAQQKLASGVAFAELRHENFGGTTLDNNNVGGNLSGKTGPLQYEATAYFTSLEDRNFQPRNRFTLSAGTGLLNVTLGDATPYFNDLVLYGRRVRGLQAGLHTGIINVDFITGETMRGVEPIPNGLSGAYRQTMWGIRPSLGGRSFQFGLTLLRARDDTTSITANRATVAPRDNLVIGADFLMSADRRRIEFKAAAAHSFMTKDTRMPIITQSYVDSLYTDGSVKLPFDPADFQDWLIINESTTPLDPTGKTALAYQLSLRFNYFNQFFTFTFKQIGSEYNSFGHTYLRNDIRGFSFYDRIRLLRNRVNLNFGLERFTDHFDNSDGKPSTALNAVQVGVLINWNRNFPTLNFNLRNYDRDNGIKDLIITNANILGIQPDTTDLRQDNRTRDFSFTVSQDLRALNYNHTVSLSLTNSDRIDRWASTRVAGFGGGGVTSDLVSINVRTRYNSPLMTTFNLAFNDNNVGGQQSQFNFNMFSGRADYEFPRQQIRTFFGMRFVGASGQSGVTGAPVVNIIKYTQTGFQLGGSILVKQRHEFVLDLALIKYSDKGGIQAGPVFTGRPSFSNNIARAHYEFRF